MIARKSLNKTFVKNLVFAVLILALSSLGILGGFSLFSQNQIDNVKAAEYSRKIVFNLSSGVSVKMKYVNGYDGAVKDDVTIQSRDSQTVCFYTSDEDYDYERGSGNDECTLTATISSGYTWKGWYTGPNGTGTILSSSQTYKFSGSSFADPSTNGTSIELYTYTVKSAYSAKLKFNVSEGISVTMKYSNGLEGSKPENVEVKTGTTQNVIYIQAEEGYENDTCQFSVKVEDGYIFKGWYTGANGTGQQLSKSRTSNLSASTLLNETTNGKTIEVYAYAVKKPTGITVNDNQIKMIIIVASIGLAVVIILALIIWRKKKNS